MANASFPSVVDVFGMLRGEAPAAAVADDGVKLGIGSGWSRWSLPDNMPVPEYGVADMMFN